MLGDAGHLTPDTWHMTLDTGHMTHNMWHLTHDTWHMTADFQRSALGRFFHRVAMCVYVFPVCPLLCNFFLRPLIGPPVTWSVQGLWLVNPPSLPNLAPPHPWGGGLKKRSYFFCFFFCPKAPWRRRRQRRQVGIKQKMLKSFLAAVLLSASDERFFVSRMRDFCYLILILLVLISAFVERFSISCLREFLLLSFWVCKHLAPKMNG